MLKLFRKHLEIETLAIGIVEDFLDTEARLIFGLLAEENCDPDTNELAEETFAFVFLIAVIGVDMSRLHQEDKEKLLSTIVDLWLKRFCRPIVEAFRFLNDQTASYLHQYAVFIETSDSAEQTKIVQMYMERLGINDPRHVAFLMSVTISLFQKAIILRDFINKLGARHRLA